MKCQMCICKHFTLFRIKSHACCQGSFLPGYTHADIADSICRIYFSGKYKTIASAMGGTDFSIHYRNVLDILILARNHSSVDNEGIMASIYKFVDCKVKLRHQADIGVSLDEIICIGGFIEIVEYILNER